MTEGDRNRLDDLRLAPAILQAYVPGTDIRVTAAGGRLFATAIDARDTCSPQDFRPAYAPGAGGALRAAGATSRPGSGPCC